MKLNKEYKRFQASIKKIAKELGCEPYEVTRREYMMYSEEVEGLTDWQIRKLGGFNAMKDFLYPEERNPVGKAIIRNTRNYKNKIDREYGDAAFLVEQLTENIRSIMNDVNLKIHPKVRRKKKKGKIKRSIVAHWSDIHAGAFVEKREVWGLNKFDWEVCSRRNAGFIDQICQYKLHYRDETELVLVINGDSIAGVIHDQEWVVDVLTNQFWGAVKNIVQGITYCAQHFSKVRVYTTVGNHGRAMHKMSKERALTKKWDAYENQVYIAVKEIVERTCANVEVDIPTAPFVIFDVQGHKILATHGDTVIKVGNPGATLNMKKLSDQVNRINAGLVKVLMEEVKVIMCGHVHVATVQQMDNGVYFVINGCVSGLDTFANSQCGIFDSHPAQQLFEVTAENPLGDFRFVNLNGFDKRKDLEKIIEPYKSPFKS